MITWIITSARDIDTWIANGPLCDYRGDYRDHGFASVFRDALQAADHPTWGSDWSEWLAGAEVAQIAAEVTS